MPPPETPPPATVPEAVGDAATLTLLVKAARDLNSSLRLEAVFEKVADRVKSLIDCDLFALMLWNKRTERLEMSFSKRFGERVDLRPEGTFPLGLGITGMAAQQRRPVRVGDVAKHPSYVHFRYASLDLRSGLAVPLMVQDRLVGVLDLESSHYDAFTREHERILSALGSIIAGALENAQLYERVRAGEERLARDVVLAREIQRALTPDAPACVEGVDVAFRLVPAQELGGDVFDVLPYGNGRLAVVVGDVAGKSTPAALYGSMAIGLLRGLVMEHLDPPAEMLDHLNRQLCKPAIDDRFLALAFALYESDTRTLTVANAGIPRPFLLRGEQTERLPLSGLALGIECDVDYTHTSTRLEPGDLFVACSDGFEECFSPRGEPYGAERLLDRIRALKAGSAQEIADGLVDATMTWAGGDVEPSDDRTVVVLKGV